MGLLLFLAAAFEIVILPLAVPRHNANDRVAASLVTVAGKNPLQAGQYSSLDSRNFFLIETWPC
jgi:hypothetical protein